jgi:hypothetical protein
MSYLDSAPKGTEPDGGEKAWMVEIEVVAVIVGEACRVLILEIKGRIGLTVSLESVQRVIGCERDACAVLV